MNDKSPQAESATHVYEGQPDARQSSAVDAPVSRFRPTYRALEPQEKALHDAIKEKASELEALFGQITPGEYSPAAMQSLELAVMWAVKQLTGPKASA